MNYKKGIIYSCVLGLIIFGASYQKWYPSLQSYLQRRAETFIEEQLEKTFSPKTTRSIPADIDLSSYLVGLFAKQAGDFKTAALNYGKVIEKDPNFTQLKNDLFILYTLTGQIDKAIKLTKDLTNITQNTFFINQLKTANWIKQKEYQKVIDFYKSASLSASDVILKPLLIAWSYAGLNNQKEAFDALDSIQDKRLEGLKLNHKALLFLYFGQKTEAMEIYRSLPIQQQSSVNTLISIDNLFKNTPEWQPGFDLFDKYVLNLQQNPALLNIISQVHFSAIQTPQQAVADAYYTVARSFADLKIMQRAALLNNIALYLDPESNLYKIGIGELYQAMEMHQAANDAFNNVKPESDIIQFKKALNLLKGNQPEEALKLLQLIEPKNKMSSLFQKIIGETYRSINEYDKSIEHYTQAINLIKSTGRRADIADIQFVLAQIYYDQNKPNDMFRILEEAILNNSKDAYILNFLGYELIDRDIDVNRGLQLVLRAFRLNPNDGHIIDSVAWGYYKQKNYAKSLDYAKKAIEKEKGNAIILMHMGDIYQQLGRHMEAMAHYRKALASSKETTPQIVQEIKQKLGETEPVSAPVTISDKTK